MTQRAAFEISFSMRSAASRPEALTGRQSCAAPPSPSRFRRLPRAAEAPESHTVEALAARIRSTTAPKKARPPWLKLARFGNARTEKGSLHHDRKVIVCSGVEGDYDGEQISFDETIETLKKVEVGAIVYTVPLISPSCELMTWAVVREPAKTRPPDAGQIIQPKFSRNRIGVRDMISDTLLEARVKMDRYLSVDDFYGINDEYRAIVDVRKQMARVCAMLDTPPSGRSAARRSGCSRRPDRDDIRNGDLPARTLFTGRASPGPVRSQRATVGSWRSTRALLQQPKRISRG